MNALSTFDDEAGNRFEIYVDEDPESPRKWDNLGTIYSNHRHYNPDRHTIEELGWPLNEDRLNREYLWLKVWGYSHSGLAITTGPRTYPFNDQWDSGLFGIIAVPRSKVREEYGCTRITPTVKRRAMTCLEGEIETLNQYLNGEVYGFIKFKGDEEVDSCWGIYAEDLDKLKAELLAEYGEKKED